MILCNNYIRRVWFWYHQLLNFLSHFSLILLLHTLSLLYFPIDFLQKSISVNKIYSYSNSFAKHCSQWYTFKNGVIYLWFIAFIHHGFHLVCFYCLFLHKEFHLYLSAFNVFKDLSKWFLLSSKISFIFIFHYLKSPFSVFICHGLDSWSWSSRSWTITVWSSANHSIYKAVLSLKGIPILFHT